MAGTRGKIAFGRIVLPLRGVRPSQAEEHLLAALPAGEPIERYRRTWRVGPIRHHGGILTGRLGFQRVTGTAEVWDPKANDFTTTAQLEGATSPFAIDATSLDVAFQLRSNTIKRTSFTGALQALLVESSGLPWRVGPLLDETSFPAWLDRVEIVTKMTFWLEPPNPNWSKRPTLKKVMADAEATSVKLILEADPEIEPTGLDLDSAIIKEALNHVEDHDYGDFQVEGRLPAEGTSKYISKQHASPPERIVEVNPETREASPEAVIAALDDMLPTKSKEPRDRPQ